MGRSRRPQSRNTTTRIPTPSAPKPAWRETFDSWGGLPVFGSILAMILVVGVLIYANRPGASAAKDAFVPTERTTVNGRTMGDPNAPVKIVEFADFQCPFCRNFGRDTEPALIKEFVNTGQVSFQYVPFAFIGQESKDAAAAAECAADQNRFWDYQDVLYLRQGTENSGVYNVGNLRRFAREVSAKFKDFDTTKFDQCVDSGAHKALIDTLAQQAAASGVTSTPTFTLNGQRMNGAQPIDVFRQAIAAAQKGTTPPAGATGAPSSSTPGPGAGTPTPASGSGASGATGAPAASATATATPAR